MIRLTLEVKISDYHDSMVHENLIGVLSFTIFPWSRKIAWQFLIPPLTESKFWGDLRIQPDLVVKTIFSVIMTDFLFFFWSKSRRRSCEFLKFLFLSKTFHDLFFSLLNLDLLMEFWNFLHALKFTFLSAIAQFFRSDHLLSLR